MDTEFTGTERLCQVAFVNLEGDTLLNAVIDYGLSRQEMLQQELAQIPTDNRPSCNVTHGALQRFYGWKKVANAVYITHAVLVEKLKQLNLSDKILVEYSCTASLDYNILRDCLRRAGSDTSQILPPNYRLSVLQLLRKMLNEPTTGGFSLIRVFGALFEGHHLVTQAHYADVDSIKTAIIFKYLQDHAGSSILEQMSLPKGTGSISFLNDA